MSAVCPVDEPATNTPKQWALRRVFVESTMTSIGSKYEATRRTTPTYRASEMVVEIFEARPATAACWSRINDSMYLCARIIHVSIVIVGSGIKLGAISNATLYG